MGVEIPVGHGQLTIPFNLTGDDREMVVTFGFEDNAAISADSIAEIFQTAWFAMNTMAASSISDQYSVGPCRVVVNRTLGLFEGFAAATRAGTNVGVSPVPQNCAYLIRKTTARGGRHGRGRVFLPPLTGGEASITPTGDIGAAAVTNWNTELEEFRVACETNSQALELLHSPPPGGVGPVIPPDNITGLLMQRVVATQRNRLRR